jgi:hypothetical protein
MKYRLLAVVAGACLATFGAGCDDGDSGAPDAGDELGGPDASPPRPDARPSASVSVDAPVVDAAATPGDAPPPSADAGPRPDSGSGDAAGGDAAAGMTARADAGRAVDAGAADALSFPPASVPQNLVAYFRLDEKGSRTALDHSNQGNHGTLVDLSSSNAWVDGKEGSALQFNGSGHVRVPSSVALNGIFTGLSMSAWVYRAPNRPGRAYVVWRADHYGFGFGSDEKLFFAVGAEQRPSPLVVTAAEPTKASEWVHVAGTYDGMHARLYVNGAEVASLAFKGSIDSSMQPLVIGGRLTGSQLQSGFAGRVDELRLYSRALSAAEIKQVAKLP